MDDEGGDGTTSVIILTGGLLEESLRLLAQNVHPHIIIAGFQRMIPKIEPILFEISIHFDPNSDKGKEIFLQVATTTLNSKFVSFSCPKLANLAVDSIVACQGNLKKIQILKCTGNSLMESKMVSGIMIKTSLDFEKVGAKVALIAFDLNKPKTSNSFELTINSSTQLDRLLKEEEEYTKKIMIGMKKLKVDVILIQENIVGEGTSDLAKQLAQKLNILLIGNVKKNTMRDICLMSSGSLMIGPEQIFPKKIVSLNIHHENLGTDNYMVLDSSHCNFCSIILQENSKMLLAEADRALYDCLRVLEVLYLNPNIISGGGSSEFYLSSRLASRISYSDDDLMDQVILDAFSDSLLCIPRILAENCGLDVFKTMESLSNYYKENLDAKYIGIHSEFGICNVYDKGLIESTNNKIAQIEMALQCVLQILKIDKNIEHQK